MKTFVKIYGDFDRTKVIYVGSDMEQAKSITMQQVEGEEYYNAGGAGHTLQVWGNGTLIEEHVEYVPDPDDE